MAREESCGLTRAWCFSEVLPKKATLTGIKIGCWLVGKFRRREKKPIETAHIALLLPWHSEFRSEGSYYDVGNDQHRQ